VVLLVIAIISFAILLATGPWTWWQGRRSAKPKGPPKTGLEIVIDKELPTNFPGTGRILEIEYSVTNHDPVEHLLRKAMRGPFMFGSGPDYDRVANERWEIEQRRAQREGFPGRVKPGETVRGLYVTAFAWDPTGKFPDYTLVIMDERREYKVRPHGSAPAVDGLGGTATVRTGPPSPVNGSDDRVLGVGDDGEVDLSRDDGGVAEPLADLLDGDAAVEQPGGVSPA
jgi:hypothetical protein